jgi:hypothetical protein
MLCYCDAVNYTLQRSIRKSNPPLPILEWPDPASLALALAEMKRRRRRRLCHRGPVVGVNFLTSISEFNRYAIHQ